MAVVPTDERPVISTETACDDLTAIKGIGPARQRWLRETFNVCTYRDMALLAVDDIVSCLKAEGKIASREEIEAWIAEAKERARAANAESRRVANTPDQEGTGNSPAAGGEWTPTDVFIMTYQVLEVEGRPQDERVMAEHIEVHDGTWMDKVTGETHEVEDEALCRWVRNQLGDRVAPAPEASAGQPEVEPSPAPAPPVKVKVTQIQAFQPPQATTPIGIGEAGEPFPGFLRGDEPFALAACLELSHPQKGQLRREQVTCGAEFDTRNLSTGKNLSPARAEPDTLEAGASSCTAVLPELTLPPGIYRLRVVGTLKGAPAAPGYIEVPVLQVI